MYEKKIVSQIYESMRNNGVEPSHLFDLLDLSRAILRENPNETEYIKVITALIKEQGLYFAEELKDDKCLELYWNTVYLEAPWLFRSYLLYTEKDRQPERQFYNPRANTLDVVVDDLQALEDGKYKFYGLSLPPRTGKSTLCIFFLSWIMGRRPNSHNAMGGHSGILAEGFHGEILNLLTSPEYHFHDVFPGANLESKSADKLTVNLGSRDRFKTLTCRGIDGTWTGAIDVSADGYLYVDDLIRDRTESLSPTRLNNRYQDYLNVMVDRKNEGSRELMVGTRWNVMDPLGRIEEDKKNNPDYLFRKIPALNRDGESNFPYKYGFGFSTDYYEDVKSRLDLNEWKAKYMQAPFIREGLLFPEEELRFYNGVTPVSGFVRNVSACDVAWGGCDSLSMPIGAEYENGDVYIYSWIHNKGAKEITIPLVVKKIIAGHIQKLNFEANNGGEMYEAYVQKELQSAGYACSLTHTRAPNKISKEAKIEQYSGDIKRKFIFLSPDLWDEEYEAAMNELMMFVLIGKNEHDDAPDGLTQLAMTILGATTAHVEFLDRRW